MHLRGYAQILATDQAPASGEDKRPIVRDSSGDAELYDYGDERAYFDNEFVGGAFEDSSDTDTTRLSDNDEEPELFKERKSSLSKESRLALRDYANTSLGDGMLLHVKPHIIAAIVQTNTFFRSEQCPLCYSQEVHRVRCRVQWKGVSAADELLRPGTSIGASTFPLSAETNFPFTEERGVQRFQRRVQATVRYVARAARGAAS